MAGQVLAAIVELLPQGGGGRPIPGVVPAKVARADFPEPYVVKPTLAQLVKGARVEYEGRPGEVLTGWVEGFGDMPTERRGIHEPPAPTAPAAMVSVNQPGSLMMTFLAPHIVPLGKILRATCAPDPAPGECWKCSQIGMPKAGGHQCAVCFRPTMHDPEEPRPAADLGNGSERP